jgi:hypothetical protein
MASSLFDKYECMRGICYVHIQEGVSRGSSETVSVHESI